MAKHKRAQLRGNTVVKEEHIGRFAVYASLIGVAVFLLYFLLGKFFPESNVLDLGAEDGPVETLAAVFWALASGICLLRLVKGQKQSRPLLVFWAAATFLFMGEEISWFQRVLGYETPTAIEQANAQGEFNLHNLGDRGTGSWTQWAFQLAFLSYFLILPLLMAWPRARTWAANVGYSAPHRAFVVMVWIVIGASYALQALGHEEARRVTAESRETFYAFVVLAYVYLYLRTGSPSTS